MNGVDPWGLATLYDIYDGYFPDDKIFKHKHPLEYLMFMEYLNQNNSDLYSYDIRYLESAWRNFSPYALKRAKKILVQKCADVNVSIVGPEAFLSKALPGLPALLVGLHSDIGTIINSMSLIGIVDESLRIQLNKGPLYVTDKTWLELTGSLTPGL